MGHGWIKKADELCGKKRGCWQNRRKKFPDMWVADYFGIAAAMGLHLTGFLEETLADELGDGVLAGLRLARPLCEPPRILRLVERREAAAIAEREEWIERHSTAEGWDSFTASTAEGWDSFKVVLGFLEIADPPGR